MTQQPVRIVGAGIGGLVLARCLLQHGIPAVLYERASSAPRYSYGITLHAASYRPLLKALNIDEETFRRRISVDGALGGSGKINPRALIRPADVDTNSFRAHRGKLEQFLHEGLDIIWGDALEKIEGNSMGMTLQSQSGKKFESSFVIGADGPHSTIRNSLLPGTPLNVLPFVAFNGKRRVKTDVFERLYARSFLDTNVVEKKQGDVVLNISIIEKTKNEVSVSWVYSRPSHGSSDPLYKPNRPNSGATDIPEDFFQEIGALKDLQQAFKGVFNEEDLRKERILHWLMRTVNVSLPELQALGKKGVFFIGDAVHAEPILGGEGANAAIRDGVDLAECIFKSGSGGIHAWYSDRYLTWEDGVKRSEKAIAEIHTSPLTGSSK